MACPTASEYLGNEVTLHFSNDGTTFTPIAVLIDVQPPKLSRGEVDTQTLAGNAKTTRPGTKDYGELGFTLVAEKTASNVMQGHFDDGVIRTYKIAIIADTATTVTQIACGWMKEYQPFDSAEKDTMIKSKGIVKLVSEIVVA